MAPPFLNKLRDRFDGFINSMTALGGTRDRNTHMAIRPGEFLQPTTLDVLYSESHFSATIVDGLPEQSFLKGIEIPEDTEGKLAKAVLEWQMLAKVEEAAAWGRLFGGALLVMGVEGDMAKPLDPDTMEAGSLEYLLVLDRMEFEKGDLGPDDEPLFYVMTGGERTQIHASRCLFFGGVRTSKRIKERNGGWDLSVLQKPYDIIRDAETNWRSVVHLMSDASQAVFKVANLVDMVAEGDLATLQARMEALQMSRSVARAITVDAEHEAFEQVGVANLDGAEALLEKTWLLVAAAARMPYTLLMGQSASGLSATGEGDQDNWFGSVNAYQKRVLGPGLTFAVKVIAAHAGIPFPDGLTITWPALKQESAQQQATTRKTVAETDAIYESMGAVLAEEIAKARWGGGVYSADMGDAIDLDAREAALEKALEELLDPPPPPMLPAPGDPSEEEE